MDPRFEVGTGSRYFSYETNNCLRKAYCITKANLSENFRKFTENFEKIDEISHKDYFCRISIKVLQQNICKFPKCFRWIWQINGRFYSSEYMKITDLNLPQKCFRKLPSNSFVCRTNCKFISGHLDTVIGKGAVLPLIDDAAKGGLTQFYELFTVVPSKI